MGRPPLQQVAVGMHLLIHLDRCRRARANLAPITGADFPTGAQMARPRARSGADFQIHELVAYRLNALTNTILRSASRQYAAGVRMSPPEAWVLGAIGHFQPITA